MRAISSANNTALAGRLLVARDFLWLVARDRDDGSPQSVGFWSDAGDVSAAVVSPDTGLEVTRSWYGSGTLIAIDDVPLVADVTVQRIRIMVSQIDELVQQAVRLYDCKQARVEIYRGLFNSSTRQMVAAAFCRFVGFVDAIEIRTPAEGAEAGGISLTCTGHTQEMKAFLDANPGLRSRFWRTLHFEDYTAGELLEIFERFAIDGDYRLDAQARSVLLGRFEKSLAGRTRTFGNARHARNLFEQALEKHAARVGRLADPDCAALQTITAFDLP